MEQSHVTVDLWSWLQLCTVLKLDRVGLGVGASAEAG